MSELVAKRWAKALLELAQEDDNTTTEKVLNDIREVAAAICSSEELSNVIDNPSISTEEKQIILCKLFQDKVTPIVYNFLFVLNLKKRLGLISEIANEYEKELEIINNVVRVDITSAIDLNDDKKNELKTKIAEKINKEIKVNWDVDTNIIAGLVLNINDTVIDNSIKHKLEELSNNIIRG